MINSNKKKKSIIKVNLCRQIHLNTFSDDTDLAEIFQLFVTVFLCISLLLVSSDWLMNDFLSACQTNGSPQEAVDLVQLSAAFCLPATAQLAKRTLAEFDLTEEQR